MSLSPKSPAEYLHDSLAPLIAVVCSPDAEAACKKNNLRFADLLQPFSKLSQDVQYRDASNVAHTVKNFRVHFRDLREEYPHPSLAQYYLNKVVDRLLDRESSLPDITKPEELKASNDLSYVDLSDIKSNLETNTTWFEAYRELFMRVYQPIDHEFLRTYIGCIFVVSTSCAEPLPTFANLVTEQYAHQHAAAARYPRWFHSAVFKHYVLLHDASEPNSKVEALFEDLKMAYGPPNCTMLTINSRSAADVIGETERVSNPYNAVMQYDDISNLSLAALSRGSGAGASYASLVTPTTNSSQLAIAKSNVASTGIRISQSVNSFGQSDGTSSTSIKDSTSMEFNSDAGSISSGTTSGISSSNCNETITVNDPLDVDEIGTSDYDELSSAQSISFSQRSAARSSLQYGALLAHTDVERIRLFSSDLLLHGVLPFLERILRTLSDSVAHAKKSMQRGVLQLTKKLFSGPGKKQSAENDINIVYTSDSAELQLRKYADLSFTLQQYETAYQTYHSLRRNFQNEHASLHFAGVSEMCAICAFLLQGARTRQFPSNYFDEAINTYLNVCRNVVYATRAVLLSTEILKARRSYNEAIGHFVRLTAEDCDLRSALFLEQAALCYASRAALRKYSFNLVLAGFRFSKAGLRRHSLRCYEAAWRTLRARKWMLAEQLIIVTLARHLHALRRPREALDVFSLMFTHPETNPNQLAQSSSQTLSYLVEFLALCKQLQVTDQSEFEVALPRLLFDRTTVLLSDDLAPENDAHSRLPGISFDDLDDNQLMEELAELEDALARDAKTNRSDAADSIPTRARPRLYGYRVGNFKRDAPADVFVDCPIRFRFYFQNLLAVPILLRRIRLVCHGDSPNDLDKLFSSEIESLLIEPAQSAMIELSLLPRRCSTLVVSAIAYELTFNNINAKPIVEANASSSESLDTLLMKQTFARPLVFRVCDAAGIRVQLAVLNSAEASLFPAGALLPVTLTFDGEPNAIHNVKVAANCEQLVVARDLSISNSSGDDTANVRTEKMPDIGSAVQSTAVRNINMGVPNTYSGTFWLRTTKTASSHFSIVVYFEKGGHFYTIPFKYVLQAAPALRINANLQLSLAANDSSGASSDCLLATIVVENAGELAADVQLTQITSVSCLYALTDLLPALANGACRIGAREAATFVARLSRIAATDDLTYASLPLSDRLELVNTYTNPTLSPSIDFYRLDRQLSRSEKSQLAHTVTSGSGDVNIDFIIFWRSSLTATSSFGQSHVFTGLVQDEELKRPAASITSGNALLQQCEESTRLLRITFDTIEHELKTPTQLTEAQSFLVQHCFNKQRFCVITLRFRVHNLELRSSVHVRIDGCLKRVASRNNSTATPLKTGDVKAVETLLSSREITVIGSSLFELHFRADQELRSQELKMRICVSRAGVFDLAKCFDVSACRVSGDAEKPNQYSDQICVPSCMLIVNDADQ